jgi:transcriptional regulator with XRE-family HTH domain
MRIGQLLYNWRFFAKLNVRDAAKLIGISPSSLSRIERGYFPDGPIMLTLMNWLFTVDPAQPPKEPVNEQAHGQDYTASGH